MRAPERSLTPRAVNEEAWGEMGAQNANNNDAQHFGGVGAGGNNAGEEEREPVERPHHGANMVHMPAVMAEMPQVVTPSGQIDAERLLEHMQLLQVRDVDTRSATRRPHLRSPATSDRSPSPLGTDWSPVRSGRPAPGAAALHAARQRAAASACPCHAAADITQPRCPCTCADRSRTCRLACGGGATDDAEPIGAGGSRQPLLLAAGHAGRARAAK